MNLAHQELIGYVELILSDAIKASNQIWKAALLNPKRAKNGSITLKIEQLRQRMSSDLVKLVIEGIFNKKNKNFFKILRKKDNSADYLPIYRSESATFLQNTARWRPAKLTSAALMRDNPECPLAIEVYEYRSNGDHVLLGQHKFTYSQLAPDYKWNAPFGII